MRDHGYVSRHARLVAGIHVLRAHENRKSWMAGTSPAMTNDL